MFIPDYLFCYQIDLTITLYLYLADKPDDAGVQHIDLLQRR
jgi:hypothetical protein